MKKALFAVAMTLAVSSMAFGALKTETFDTDPGWTYYSNLGTAQGTIWGDTGTAWAATNNAGGAAAGEGTLMMAENGYRNITFYGDYAVQGVASADLQADGKLIYQDNGFGLQMNSLSLVGFMAEDNSFLGLGYWGDHFQAWYVDAQNGSWGTGLYLDFAYAGTFADNTVLDFTISMDANGILTAGVTAGGSSAIETLDLSGSNVLSKQFDVFGLGTMDLSNDSFNATKVSIDDVTYSVVPEPATMSLLGLGGLGALIRRRR